MIILQSLFTTIKQALTNKYKETNIILEKISADSFPSVIRNIEQGTNTNDATADVADIQNNITAYVGGKKIVGTGNNLMKTKATITSNSTDFYIGSFSGSSLMLQTGNVGNSARFYVTLS